MKRPEWLYCVAVFLLVAGSASATTIDPMSIEEQIVKADLIALVKVETASGFYSKCRIVKSVKGNPKEDIVLYTPPGPHGPYFPHDLVGELLVVYAYKSTAPSRLVSTSSASPNVLTARKLSPDYQLPLWQGKYEVQDEKRGRESLAYAQEFLNRSPKEKSSFFIRERVAKRYGSLRARGDTAMSEQMRVVAFSKDEDRVMAVLGTVPREYLTAMGMYFPKEEKVTYAMIEEARKQMRGEGPNKYDMFSIEADPEKTLSRWAALKQEILTTPLNTSDPHAHERVMGIESYANTLAGNTPPADGSKDELYHALLNKKPTAADLKRLEKDLEGAEPHDLGGAARIYARWGLSPPEKLLADMSATVVKDQVTRGHGHVNRAIWHLFSLSVPKNASDLAALLRGADNKQDVSSKLSLLAFYGDRDARKTVEKRLSSVSKYNDHRYNADKSIVASSDIYWEHEALLSYDEPLLVEIAQQNEFIRPKILVLLLRRGSEQSVRTIAPLFDTLTPEQRQDVLASVNVERHWKVFKEQYSKMAPDAKLACLLEMAENLGRHSSLGGMETWFKEEAAPMIAETMKSDAHKDQLSILRGLWVLASSGHPDCAMLIEKYSPVVGRVERAGDFLYMLTSVWARNLKEKTRLVSLAQAKNTDIRVPALIYLMIVDEKEYAPLLSKLATGDSIVNARAALALAERGRTDSLPKLLALLSKKEESGDYERQWGVIQQRVDVLFSNATEGKTNGMKPQELATYWAKHKDRLKLRDPWRENWDDCFCE